MILLAAATALEIPHFTHNKINDINVLLTGAGMPAALFQLQKEISTHNYSLVVQAGIAGAYSAEFSLKETVLVKQDCFADLGADEQGRFTSLFEMGLAGKNDFPYKDGWLFNEHPYLKKSHLELVKAATVNKVTDNAFQIDLIKEKLNPEIETMEGAALHYVCLMENIPFLQVRSISNYVGERNKANWKINEAVAELNEVLMKIINDLK